MRKGIIIPLLLLPAVFAQTEKLDMAMMSKIRDEGLNHSQVMEIVFNLTDANGPRLMESPGYFKAANWAKNKLFLGPCKCKSRSHGVNGAKGGNWKNIIWP